MADWTRIDIGSARIDGLVLRQEGVLAWGADGDAPYAAQVEPDGAVAVAVLPGRGPITSATHQEQYELTIGSPPLHVAGDFPGGFVDDHFYEADWTVVDDAERLWVTCGDEDPMYVAVRADGELFAVDPGIGLAGGPSGLFLETEAPLLVAGREVGVCVAGRLRTSDGAGPQWWTCFEIEEGWRRIQVDPAPDAFTDLVEAWEPLAAGHRDLRPLAWGQDGTSLEVPDVMLDPSYPMVSVASERPEHAPLSLALQTVDGPQLWTRTDDGWTGADLPSGHLVTARRDLGDQERVWTVIDGALWTGA
jgi:hypothetical protein